MKALARDQLRARSGDGTRVRLRGVAEHGGHVLDHLEADVKHNETSPFTAVLEPLDLAGAVVTFDALHTVRANLNWLAGRRKPTTSRWLDRTLQSAHVCPLDSPRARQAIKITGWRRDAATGKTSRETAYVVTSLTSAQDLARLVREYWSIAAHYHVRDVTFGGRTTTSGT